jgi:hypothetical protein
MSKMQMAVNEGKISFKLAKTIQLGMNAVHLEWSPIWKRASKPEMGPAFHVSTILSQSELTQRKTIPLEQGGEAGAPNARKDSVCAKSSARLAHTRTVISVRPYGRARARRSWCACAPKTRQRRIRQTGGCAEGQ